MNNQIILYHCKQITLTGQTVREFQVVAYDLHGARCIAMVLLDGVEASEGWGIEVYPLSQIAAVVLQPQTVEVDRLNPACLPAWGAK